MDAGGDEQKSIPLITPDTIKTIAQTVGIANLKEEVADALAPDVEYRLRDIVQEALKFMSHGRRDSLTTEDINYALRLRNAEPLYGFASHDAPRFCRAGGQAGVFYLEDPEINLADIINEPLPAVPVEPSFTTHWLAINGVQPTIPQNPTSGEVAADRQSRKRPLGAEEPSEVEVNPLARHALTQEEQAWLERVTSAVRKGVPSMSDGGVDPADAQARCCTLVPSHHFFCAHTRVRAAVAAQNGSRALLDSSSSPPPAACCCFLR